MTKESSPTIPKVVIEKPVLSVQDLLVFTKEQWARSWQDQTFLKSFPNLVTHLISSDVREQFTEDQRAKLFTNGLLTFITNRGGTVGLTFGRNGEIKRYSRRAVSPEQEDKFSTAVIGHLMLIPMTLSSENKINVVTEAYKSESQCLKTADRTELMAQITRLLKTNNATRAFIKESKLDVNNGFEWDNDLTIFSLSMHENRDNAMIMPTSIIKDPQHFSPQTLTLTLDYIIRHSDTLKKSAKSIDLGGFATQVEELINSGKIPPEAAKTIQEKLTLVKDVMGIKTNSLRY